ncbi:MAG: heme ABC transporter ATP-binding protein [Actinobacteria bacterium]|nr:heme ABC transporter ATP-binding protein [Actinomycetota bacterium]
MTAPLLAAEGLVLRAGGAVLVDGVGLSVLPGEIIGVVGPNGAGKTSLLRLLSGELAPSRGSVTLDGKPLSAWRPLGLARRRAVLPQQTLLQFAFRCLDVVLMGRYAHRGSPADQDLAAARLAMSRTDTLHLASRLYPTLSAGEQARVSLARVLAQEATVLLLDEPTASLDLRHQELVMGMLRGLAEAGAGVVAVLHDLNLAARFAGRVALMSGGRLAALAPTREVLAADLLSEVYRHPVVVVPHPHLDCPLVLPGAG